MNANFPTIMNLIFIHEGGYVDNKNDRGGATKYGITHRTLAAFRGIHPFYKLPKSDVYKLGKKEAEGIYKASYWSSFKGSQLPVGVDYVVMDYAVNSGVSRSAKYLQRAVGVKADGVVGVITLNAVYQYADHAKLINILCDRRLSFLQRLRSWRFFKRGWSRRVTSVRQDALAMLDTVSSHSGTLTLKEKMVALGL